MVLGLATGDMHVGIGRFWLRCDSNELVVLDYHEKSWCMVMLRCCLGLGAFSANKPRC
jgi:hypothetical protein